MAIATTNPATGEVLKNLRAPLACPDRGRRYGWQPSAFSDAPANFVCRIAPQKNVPRRRDPRKRERGMWAADDSGNGEDLSVPRSPKAAKCATGCRYYGENAERFSRGRSGGRNWGQNTALFAINHWVRSFAIMPWNFPFWQVFRFVAPALMAGKRRSPEARLQCSAVGALKIEEIIHRAGFPEGVFQTLLIGPGPVDGILNDPRVAAATLYRKRASGPSRWGFRRPRRIKKVVLELGGSDPFYRNAERRSGQRGRDSRRSASTEQRAVLH